MVDPLPYLDGIERVLGRALSLIDAEPTSPSQGSFDRTWWCWKFVDFSAARFQEGTFTLAWLYASPLAPPGARGNPRFLRQAEAALRFWSSLQHADGSFDEAYPFERSLAATAFTGFYCGSAIERLKVHLTPEARDLSLRALEGAAAWLSANGEYHGVLSNHLAAAAACLQVAMDLLGQDRFRAARDRYLDIIYREQDQEEGWLREYGGADPGYQSHGMFYLADIWRRTKEPELLARLTAASDFMAWFVHPDGSVGGEYASRGTKFAYPAGFEILAPVVASSAAIARHLRHCVRAGRCIGPFEVDRWNLFPLLNNYLFAAEAAEPLDGAGLLPWQREGAQTIFPAAGLAVFRRGDRLVAAAPGRGGALKVWEASTGRLVYEDCGYTLSQGGRSYASQFPSEWRSGGEDGEARLEVTAAFKSVPSIRFTPVKFTGFRSFTLTLGRSGPVARWLKQFLVAVLIKKRAEAPGLLRRLIRIGSDGTLSISDELSGLESKPAPLDRHVPIHMGSARYVDFSDSLGATRGCPDVEWSGGATARREVAIAPEVAQARRGADAGPASDLT